MRILIAVLLLSGCGDPLPVGGSGGGSGGGAGGGTGGQLSDGGRRAFLTSTTYSGNLKIAGNASSSGYEGANTLCARHAADAGLGGQWIAFVGSIANAPATRVSGSGPWSKRLPDGGQSVAIVSLASALVASVDVDERGGAASGEIWSGRAGPACSDWHAETGEGIVGSPTPAAGIGWQNTGSRVCNLKFSLLCLEQ